MLDLGLFNQLKLRTRTISLFIFMTNISLNEPVLVFVNALLTMSKKGKNQTFLRSDKLLSGVNMHKSTGATDFRSKVKEKIIKGLLLKCSPQEGASAAGWADGATVARVYPCPAITPALWALLPLHLTGEGSSKCDRQPPATLQGSLQHSPTAGWEGSQVRAGEVLVPLL